MYNVVDPTDSRWVYNTRELNVMGRMDQKTGVRTDISPGRAGSGDPRLRYNWIAPIALSPHNPQIVYAGAQLLFRSLDRGDHWEEISPDLTTNDPDKIGHNVPFCTITTISESPLKAGTIWVGTDDGKVQVTTNHGGTWTDVTPALVAAGAPVDRWVSRVFASPFDANTAFVSKTGYRNDDFAPYLYRTTDGGKTWTSISANLPKAGINVVVQDRKNKNLLVVGNDVGVFVSIDSRRELVAAQGQSADRVGDGSRHSSARGRSRARHVRTRILDGRHHAAAGAHARGARSQRAPVRRGTAPALRFRRPGHELSLVRRPVRRGPERTRRTLDQLLPEGGGSGGCEA